MKWLIAFSISYGVFAACYVVSALVYFDLTWILIGLTSLWAGFDSKRIGLYRYKVGISCRPVTLFCCCYLLWLFIFPWYLWARLKIKAGEAVLKSEAPEGTSSLKSFLLRISKKTEPVGDWLAIGIVVLKLAVLALFIEESWRGPRVWENYRHELEAKGESFDWDAMTPPRVPASQNIFSAPKMAEWFIKPSKSVSITDDLSKRMADTNAATSPVIATVTILPPAPGTGAPPAAAVFRYSSPGTALFPVRDPPADDNQPPATNIVNVPLIQFENVPVTTAIENLARQAGINYLLDPKIGYGEPDANGQMKPEPAMTVRWENFSCRDALFAVLNQHGLQLIDDPNTGIARITIKNDPAPAPFMDASVQTRLGKLFEQATGPSTTGSQGATLLTRTPDQIKPVWLVLYSEKMPDAKELTDLFGKFFADSNGNLGAPKIQVSLTGTNSFRVSILRTDTAVNYLAWSDRFIPDFNVMRAGLKRPYARMDGDYSRPTTVPIPNFVNLRIVAQTLAQRAQCYLLLSQPAQALQELTLLGGLRRLMEGAPTGKPMPLVSAMINVAVTGLYTDVIADGFRLHAWQEPQLVALQKQLASVNLTAPMSEAMHGEQVFAWRMMQAEVLPQYEVRRMPGATLWQKVKNLRPPNIVRGFGYFSAYNVVRIEQLAVDGIEPATRIVRPERLAEFQKATEELDLRKNWIFSPYYLLAAIAVPNYVKAITTFAFNQSRADEAQIACALERYRLAHDSYPATLEELVPQFMEKLPHDIIGGQALKYHRTSGGRFSLYSVGANGIDDGGQATNARHETGDWCWQ